MTIKFSSAGQIHTNSVGMVFVPIPAGSFMMGGNKHFDGDLRPDELPQHEVSIRDAFYLGKVAVTQEAWVAVMGGNPSGFKGRTLPVEKVSWDDAQTFIQTLNDKEGTKAYRLPTEAEWEYAARAKTETTRYWGDEADDMALYAWHNQGDDQRRSHPVGLLKPNAWGLYDMLGNLHEWCQDRYGPKFYAKSSVKDPEGPAKGEERVLRGGSWNDSASVMRASYRFHLPPDARFRNVGFRVLMRA